MYAGLTTADKGALLDAKKYGKWIAKDASGTLYAYRNKPVKKSLIGGWYDMTWVALKWIYISFIHWDDDEPVNIDLALAQIAEMESKAETILGYPIEHLQKIAAIMQATHITPEDVKKCADNFTLAAELTMNAMKEHMDKTMREHIEKLQAFYSPYTEGETK